MNATIVIFNKDYFVLATIFKIYKKTKTRCAEKLSEHHRLTTYLIAIQCALLEDLMICVKNLNQFG